MNETSNAFFVLNNGIKVTKNFVKLNTENATANTIMGVRICQGFN
jgi:hypothetical protein